ncbi:hypothetical protein [Novosphingobium sp. HII-3]|uniref:hypothetical protein n=1 Tax=Novosphingobium sp. HII-3 TaxID=2075565 RepID=UPI000CDB35D1|nr:hypothetical protein [Novosphingobium sp. HII-3]
MRDSTTIVRERQSAIRRELDRRGILLKTVAMDAGMSLSTVQSYFPSAGSREPAIIPASALFCLFDAIPDDLLSILLPSGRMIVRVPEELDHDELEAACREYLAAKGRAHHPESPGKREIADCENHELTKKAVRLVAVAA